jgi:hypothetical protein
MSPWIKLIIAAVIGGLIVGGASAALGIPAIIPLGILAALLAAGAFAIASRQERGEVR